MPLANLKRRMTMAKHARNKSDTSSSDDSDSHMPYITHSTLNQTGADAFVMSNLSAFADPAPSMSRTRSGSPPPRPPRYARAFERPRAAPLPPPGGSPTSSPIAHSPPPGPSRSASASPVRTPVATAPPVPPRAMPPWRSEFITLAQGYGSLSSSTHADLMGRLHDQNLNERQALAVLRQYIDDVHSSQRNSSSRSSYSGSDDGDVFGLAV